MAKISSWGVQADDVTVVNKVAKHFPEIVVVKGHVYQLQEELWVDDMTLAGTDLMGRFEQTVIMSAAIKRPTWNYVYFMWDEFKKVLADDATISDFPLRGFLADQTYVFFNPDPQGFRGWKYVGGAKYSRLL